MGPLLFLIYVNDIGNAVPNEIIKLFADDTNLFVFGESFSIVNQKANDCLNDLYRWFIANKLSLNLTKTCYMVFKAKGDDNVELNCGRRIIQKVDNCLYLGVIIDNELKWTLHIEQLYCKLIKFTSIFYKLRSKLPERILRQLYFAFVHSRIMFGIELYANTCSTYLDKLIKLNNKLLRILQNSPLFVPTRDLYLKYNTLPINELHEYHLLTFVHKFVFHPELLPPVFIRNNYFVFNDQVHQYNIRNKKDLYINSCNTTFGKRDSRFGAASLWNNLPLSLKNVSSEKLFNNKLKMLLSERL